MWVKLNSKFFWEKIKLLGTQNVLSYSLHPKSNLSTLNLLPPQREEKKSSYILSFYLYNRKLL